MAGRKVVWWVVRQDGVLAIFSSDVFLPMERLAGPFDDAAAAEARAREILRGQ